MEPEWPISVSAFHCPACWTTSISAAGACWQARDSVVVVVAVVVAVVVNLIQEAWETGGTRVSHRGWFSKKITPKYSKNTPPVHAHTPHHSRH